MIKLAPTLQSDLDLLVGWVAVDPWHKENETWKKAEGMVTGFGLLSFKLCDSKGVVFFVRFDADNGFVRLAVQYAPETVVSKRRVAIGISHGLVPAAIEFAKNNGYKGLVFESVSPALIGFGARLGFVKVPEKDDFILEFQRPVVAVVTE